MTEIIDCLKKYTDGKQNTEKVEISVLKLNRVIKALEQEPMTGHWIDKTHQSGCGVHFIHIECSECGEPSGLNNAYARYCPWCGTKMIRSQESEGDE